MSEKTPEEVLELARQRIASRKAEERIQVWQEKQSHILHERPWLYGFVGIFGTLLLALLFTPGLPLQWKMYAIVHGVCAQQHNIILADMQFPICARNAGIYSSFLVSLCYLWALGRSRAGRIPPWSITAVLGAFVLIMAIDGFNSLFLDMGLPHLYLPRNDLRTLTGMGMGVAIAVTVLLIFNLSLRKDVNDQQPVFKNWLEFSGVLLLNFLVLAAIYGNLEFMFWPLAFLAFFGITGVMYVVNVLLCSVFLGYSGTVTSLVQLARPATLALIPTAVMLASLSYLRYWLEGQGLML